MVVGPVLRERLRVDGTKRAGNPRVGTMRAAGSWLPRLFWTTLWFDILAGPIVVISVKITPVPQYELSDALLLLLSILLLGGSTTVVAMYRHPAVHAIGLVVAITLSLLYARFYRRVNLSGDWYNLDNPVFARAIETV
jgi:hypothetical protein